jgi:hypothetical protein
VKGLTWDRIVVKKNENTFKDDSIIGGPTLLKTSHLLMGFSEIFCSVCKMVLKQN